MVSCESRVGILGVGSLGWEELNSCCFVGNQQSVVGCGAEWKDRKAILRDRGFVITSRSGRPDALPRVISG